MKRPGRKTLVALVLITTIGVGGYLLATGGMPLQHGVKLGDGRVTLVVDRFMAAYIVDLDDGRVLLVDATMDENATAIKESLAAMDKSASDVAAILFTHGHGDHIAGALAFSGARVFAIAADADLAEGRRVAYSMAGRMRDPELTGINVTDQLADGDVISIGGTSIQVFAIPGHTLGSAAFLVRGVLFLGDSAAATSGGTIGGPPPFFSADREMGKMSLQRLAQRLDASDAVEIETLAFGHQGPLTGLAPLRNWANEQ